MATTSVNDQELTERLYVGENQQQQQTALYPSVPAQQQQQQQQQQQVIYVTQQQQPNVTPIQSQHTTTTNIDTGILRLQNESEPTTLKSFGCCNSDRLHVTNCRVALYESMTCGCRIATERIYNASRTVYTSVAPGIKFLCLLAFLCLACGIMLGVTVDDTDVCALAGLGLACMVMMYAALKLLFCSKVYVKQYFTHSNPMHIKSANASVFLLNAWRYECALSAFSMPKNQRVQRAVAAPPGQTDLQREAQFIHDALNTGSGATPSDPLPCERILFENDRILVTDCRVVVTTGLCLCMGNLPCFNRSFCCDRVRHVSQVNISRHPLCPQAPYIGAFLILYAIVQYGFLGYIAGRDDTYRSSRISRFEEHLAFAFSAFIFFVGFCLVAYLRTFCSVSSKAQKADEEPFLFAASVQEVAEMEAAIRGTQHHYHQD